MKVGVDGVLLGAWTDVSNTNKILDIGTGSGLLALMLAQRTSAHIDAIDIDENAVIQAKENIGKSNWSDRISVNKISVQQLAEQASRQYDLIISNPPYFVSSLHAPIPQRTSARHTTDLSHTDLIVCSQKMLMQEGKLCIVLPVKEAEDCISIAGDNGLYCTRKTIVYPKQNLPPKRILLQFESERKSIFENSLVIETEIRHVYTPEYQDIVRDFYLKM